MAGVITFYITKKIENTDGSYFVTVSFIGSALLLVVNALIFYFFHEADFWPIKISTGVLSIIAIIANFYTYKKLSTNFVLIGFALSILSLLLSSVSLTVAAWENSILTKDTYQCPLNARPEDQNFMGVLNLSDIAVSDSDKLVPYRDSVSCKLNDTIELSLSYNNASWPRIENLRVYLKYRQQGRRAIFTGIFKETFSNIIISSNAVLFVSNYSPKTSTELNIIGTKWYPANQLDSVPLPYGQISEDILQQDGLNLGDIDFWAPEKKIHEFRGLMLVWLTISQEVKIRQANPGGQK